MAPLALRETSILDIQNRFPVKSRIHIISFFHIFWTLFVFFLFRFLSNRRSCSVASTCFSWNLTNPGRGDLKGANLNFPNFQLKNMAKSRCISVYFHVIRIKSLLGVALIHGFCVLSWMPKPKESQGAPSQRDHRLSTFRNCNQRSDIADIH